MVRRGLLIRIRTDSSGKLSFSNDFDGINYPMRLKSVVQIPSGCVRVPESLWLSALIKNHVDLIPWLTRVCYGQTSSSGNSFRIDR